MAATCRSAKRFGHRVRAVAHNVHALSRLQAASDDAVDEDNFRCGPVFISGASGDIAAAVNGYYEPMLGFGTDGRAVYAKYGGGGVWCMRSMAAAACASSTLGAFGKSNVWKTRARVHAWPVLQVDAHWSTVLHAYGTGLLQTGPLKISA